MKNYKKARSALRKIQAQRRSVLDRIKKIEERIYYNIRALLGYWWAVFFILIGARQTGKSYQVQEATIRDIMKGKKIKFYNVYRSQASMDDALANNCKHLFEPLIVKKYLTDPGYNVERNKNVVYARKYQFTEDKNGKTKKKLLDEIQLCECLSLSSNDKDKQLSRFDASFDGDIVVILNEMNPGIHEARRYDTVAAFINTMENLLRNRTKRTRIFLLGNDMSDVSEIMTAFNFMPLNYGIYKIYKKRAVIHYIKPTEAYKKMREESVANLIGADLREFSQDDEIKQDVSLVCRTKFRKPTMILAFSKNPNKWFTLWDGNKIKRYCNEKKSIYAMKRYLDQTYDQNVFNQIIQMYDSRALTFKDLTTKKLFQNELELIKK